MAIQYEINTLKNIPGSEEGRKYVKLHIQRHDGDHVLYEHSEKFSGVKRGTIKNVMSTMQDYMVEMLTDGIRFHLPEIGYFTLSVELVDKGTDNSSSKGTSKQKVRVRGINFKPDTALMERIRQQTKFELANYSIKSQSYEEEELRKKIVEYFTANRILTRKAMFHAFDLKQYAATKWLNHFCETGFLIKQGTDRHPSYVLGNQPE